MFDSGKIFKTAKKLATKTMDTSQQIMGNVTDKIVDKEIKKNSSQYEIYEVFIPTLGVGRKFVFTEKSLIVSDEEYLYDTLLSINIVDVPTKLTDGQVDVLTKSGKKISLMYGLTQNERFMKMLTYANEKIETESNSTKKYKLLFQSKSGTKIEAYEEYIILYKIDSDLSSVVKHTLQSGVTGEVIGFDDLTIRFIEESMSIELEYVKNNKGDSVILPVDSFNEEKAKKLLEFIHEKQNNVEETTSLFENENWGRIIGENRQFSINGKTLDISKEMDIYNTYRNKFHALALKCRNEARKEYDKKVVNFITFTEFYVSIYNRYLDVLIGKALDICITEEIYTESKETLLQEHLEDFHSGLDIVDAIIEEVNSAVNTNRKQISSLMNNIPTLVGGGFGTKAAVKGIAKAETFNAARNIVGKQLMEGVSDITPEQQDRLYSRIQPDVLFSKVLDDYWKVYLTLCFVLRKNKVSVWLPPKDSLKDVTNILGNLSNPNFPQEKIIDTLISLMEKNPFSVEYFEFLHNKYGETEEVQKISQYFYSWFYN